MKNFSIAMIPNPNSHISRTMLLLHSYSNNTINSCIITNNPPIQKQYMALCF